MCFTLHLVSRHLVDLMVIIIVLNGWKLTAAALRVHNVTLRECVPSRDSKESVRLHKLAICLIKFDQSAWVFISHPTNSGHDVKH